VYRLDSRFAQGHFTVTVVGCGGTGGFAAEGLARLLPKRADLVLVDHDLVEEPNLTRQNFTREELGMRKSEALARRLANRYDRPVGYSTLPVAMADLKLPGLLIGCVDNGPARRDIAEKARHFYAGDFGYSSWWVDAGNGENYGQVLIGNTMGQAVWIPEKELCLAVFLPTLQRRELLAEVPPAAPGCAQIPEQGPTINQVMASLVVEVVRRLIEGTCHWMQLCLDLEMGNLYSIPATPEGVERITGNKCFRRKARR
jgi:hypothetical protein